MYSKAIFKVLIVLLSISILANFSFAQKDEPKKEETITCPVSGESVVKAKAVGPYKYNDTEFYFCCNSCMEKFKKDPEAFLNKATDLVCGMSVDKRAAIKTSYEGKDYYFCNEKCKAAFEKDPKTYAMKATKPGSQHSEKCKDEGCCAEKKEGKSCCSSKTKTEQEGKQK